MENIQIDLYLECCLEVYKFSSVHILHPYMKHDKTILQVRLYIFVLNDVYDHKVMHDVKLKQFSII
jgi:hypothetical protein